MSEMILHINIRYNHVMMIQSPSFTLVCDGYVLLIDFVFLLCLGVNVSCVSGLSILVNPFGFL